MRRKQINPTSFGSVQVTALRRAIALARQAALTAEEQLRDLRTKLAGKKRQRRQITKAYYKEQAARSTPLAQVIPGRPDISEDYSRYIAGTSS